MFCDFFERSSKWPDTGEKPSMDVKAFNVLPATRPSAGECWPLLFSIAERCDNCCCCCWMFRRAAAISALLWFIPSPLPVKSSMESSRASFSNARWSPIGFEWSLSFGDDGGDINRSLSSKIDIASSLFSLLSAFPRTDNRQTQSSTYLVFTTIFINCVGFTMRLLPNSSNFGNCFRFSLFFAEKKVFSMRGCFFGGFTT